MAYYVTASAADLPDVKDVPVGCYARALDTGVFYRNQSLGRGWLELDGVPDGYRCTTCDGLAERPAAADPTTMEPCPRCDRGTMTED